MSSTDDRLYLPPSYEWETVADVDTRARFSGWLISNMRMLRCLRRDVPLPFANTVVRDAWLIACRLGLDSAGAPAPDLTVKLDRDHALVILDIQLRWCHEPNGQVVGNTPNVHLVPLGEEDEAILQALGQAYPTTLSQEGISGNTRLSDRTVRAHLKYMSEKALVSRPLGPKSGYTLTDFGKKHVKGTTPAER